MIRLLLNRYHAGAAKELLDALPEQDAQKIRELPVESSNPFPLLSPPWKRLGNIHYTWIHKYLRGLSKDKLQVALALLPESIAGKLRKSYFSDIKPAKLSPAMQGFLASREKGLYPVDEVLPLEYLHRTEMTRIAELTKEELVEVIDFLGLFDLADEIKHIVDKVVLEKVYHCLTKKKQQFLKDCLTQKEKLVTQRLQLENWDGDDTKLMKLLHHRGIVRLGYALSGQHPDLIWHVSHVLDVGRAEKLARYISKEPIPSVTEALIKQVARVIKFFEGIGKT